MSIDVSMPNGLTLFQLGQKLFITVIVFQMIKPSANKVKHKLRYRFRWFKIQVSSEIKAPLKFK